ncbi:hypothetical protein A5782_24245 [Mycobacterium sp. 852002-40037_SCH5390672]|nr:hypothetical protein A5782_24245 [Mycobacterium sp. 852002-40037_SCH5390672]
MDPGRFHSGRWLLLAEGVLVSTFGIAGLISAALHPHAGPTGAPVLGLSTTPAQSAILLAFGVAAIAAIGNRRAAITVTALSAIAYFMLLFFSSVATARAKPTPLGFHAADIVLHGVLGVVNLALLMWLIPDELGDEAWGPRRGRGRNRRQRSAFEAITEPAAGSMSAAAATKPGPPSAAAAAPAQESGAQGRPPPPPEVVEQPRQRGPTKPHEANEPSTHDVPNSTRPKHSATRTADAVLSHAFVPVAVAFMAAVVGIVIWIRRRR